MIISENGWNIMIIIKFLLLSYLFAVDLTVQGNFHILENDAGNEVFALFFKKV